ncbi:MAG: DUF488 family protein [Candidatus Lokiarchaeota archaeon]|nr:DUF488 family protein [Candidatus Lokiarchaeota archaeon]
MLYRKKLLLATVELFGGEVNATNFQKLLFLISQKQADRRYDFVPYKFGCFSFQAMTDKNALIKKGYLENTKNWKLSIKERDFLTTLSKKDRQLLVNTKDQFGNFKTHDLIRYIYLHYPYFAINSEIVHDFLSKKEIEKIYQLKPQNNEICLFTIGYEGDNLERYLNKLIKSNIKALFDVRKNPVSRKYGFSKKTLQNACEAIGIEYIHLPELGIESEKRKNLKSQADYDDLFLDYEKLILPKKKDVINFIHNRLSNYKRIALTCYEALPQKCHRTRIANAVFSLNNKLRVKHI